MNRQVVGFLSLFSLVLVLSVYYVAAPSNQTDAKEVNNNVSENINVESEEYYFSAYSLIRDENHKQTISEQVAIISSDESTSEEVVIARERVALEEQIMETEKALEEIINAIPFSASYVEITEDQFLMKAYTRSYSKEKEIDMVLSIFEETDSYIISNNLSFVNTELAEVEIVY